MALNERMLPLGTTRKERTGDWLYTMEVVDWNDKLKCNVWAEKTKKYSPARGINVHDFVEATKRSEDWDRAMSLARKQSKKEN